MDALDEDLGEVQTIDLMVIAKLSQAQASAC
jgi:hypothetical protein